MNPARYKIYCAGALFNAAEKEEMKHISETFQRKGFITFLPHEDGIELVGFGAWLEGVSRKNDDLINKGIFALDTYLVTKWCDGVVVNLNGRVPDEGAVVEAALAWWCDKAVLAYKADPRILLREGDNPLVSGLARFTIVKTIEELPDAMLMELKRPRNSAERWEKGGKIAQFLLKSGRKRETFEELERLLRDLFVEA